MARNPVESSQRDRSLRDRTESRIQAGLDPGRLVKIVVENASRVVTVGPEVMSQVNVFIRLGRITIVAGEEEVRPFSLQCGLGLLRPDMFHSDGAVETDLAIRTIIANSADQVIPGVAVIGKRNIVAVDVLRPFSAVHGRIIEPPRRGPRKSVASSRTPGRRGRRCRACSAHRASLSLHLAPPRSLARPFRGSQNIPPPLSSYP